MKISAFSLIRNGVTFDYPFLEAFRSVLPIVDELVLNVGRGDDETLKTLQAFQAREGAGKVVIFETDWPLNDPEKKKGGLILSEMTNLALDRCQNDWCVYLQSDEVLHEDDLPILKNAIESAAQDPRCEGLLFDYLHFYGSFDVVRQSRSAYRREVRCIRKSSGARSVGDAQSFRKPDGSKLWVKRSGARIFHYGWVRPPEVMKEKTYFMDQLYHGDPSAEAARTRTPHTGENYRYKKIWGLRKFKGTHPQVMMERIASKGWNWDLANSPAVWEWKDAKKIVLDTIERLTGIRMFEYRSYRILK